MSLFKSKNWHGIVVVLEDVLSMYKFQKHITNEKCEFNWWIAGRVRNFVLTILEWYNYFNLKTATNNCIKKK